MPSTNQASTLPLLEAGLSQAELIQAIALRYQQAMFAKSPGQPDSIREYHILFATKIIARDFDGLEFICNGLNQTGKAVFGEVTGVKLPKAQGASREALREWCGVSKLDDRLAEAQRSMVVWHRSAERELGEGMPNIVTAIEGWYASGLVELVKLNGKTYIANRARTQGVDLSARGAQFAKYRRYLEAYLELQQIRVERGDMVEPTHTPPVVVAPATEAEPRPAAGHHAAQTSAPHQCGFDF